MSTFPSILYVGATSPTSINNPDILILENHSIEAIRQIPLFFATKPIKNKTKLCIIPQAHLLQIPAQNALLKILEEPGSDNFFELYTTYPQRLLATIRSRCHIIRQPPKNQTSIVDTKYTPSLQLSDSLATDKDSVSAWLFDQIIFHKQELIAKPNPEIAQKIKNFNKALNMLNNNVDAKSCLDWLFLS